MLNSGYILDERYEIINRIGLGGMSYVFRAKDTKLGRMVAIKVLKEELSEDEEFVERFKNEASSAAQLSHPNIVAVYDIVDSGSYHYIVMELVEGITLKNYISRKEILSNKETIGIAIQAAEGIDEAHRSGIIHRDIKPQNIIISKDGKIKVADFGIAKAVTGDTLNNQAVIGSAHYISPEQAKTGEADARSDLYSLGISMYEMITGRVPYEGDNTVNIIMAHIQNAMVPPSVYNHDIYPALNDIIVKATKKDPQERYQSGRELVEDLKHAVNDPNGHFVKLYDTVAPSEKAEKPEEPEETEEKPEVITSGTAQAGEVPEKDEKAVLTDLKEAGKEKRRRIFMTGAFVMALFAFTIFALVMLKMAGDRKLEISNLETETVVESAAEESETDMDYTLSIHGEDLMPDLIGMTVDEAGEKLAGLNLEMDSSTTAYSEEYKKGIIINQNPAKSEVLTNDTAIYVTVSLGSEREHVLENLKNMSTENAALELTRVGFALEQNATSVFRNDVAEGFVCGYAFVDETGTVLEEVLTPEDTQEVQDVTDIKSNNIQLIISRGKQEDYCQVPDLRGFTRGDAAVMFEAIGLKIGTILAINTADYGNGAIVGQSIPSGEYAKIGTSVDLQISVGNSGEIPDGTILSDGTDVLTDVGKPNSTAPLSADYFYGSIDTICSVGEGGGPGTAEEILVGVRLVQRVNDSVEYTSLSEPIPVSRGERIPVCFKNIRGAYGVDSGTIEVFNVETDDVYASFVIGFGPID